MERRRKGEVEAEVNRGKEKCRVWWVEGKERWRGIIKIEENR